MSGSMKTSWVKRIGYAAVAAIALSGAALSSKPAEARVYVGIGFPGYYGYAPGPYYGYPYGGYPYVAYGYGYGWGYGRPYWGGWGWRGYGRHGWR